MYPKEILTTKTKRPLLRREHRRNSGKVDRYQDTCSVELWRVVLSFYWWKLLFYLCLTAYLTIDMRGYSAVTGHNDHRRSAITEERKAYAVWCKRLSLLSAGAGSYLTKLRKAGKSQSTLLKLLVCRWCKWWSKVVYAFVTDKDPKAKFIGNWWWTSTRFSPQRKLEL